MSAAVLRWAGATAGAAVALVGGLVAGGWWVLVAVVVGGASFASVSGRGSGSVHAAATLALVPGVLVADRGWVVAVLVAGVVVTVEAGAAADRVTVVRERAPDLDRVIGRTVLSALVALGVVVLGAVAPAPTVPLGLAAILGGGVLVAAVRPASR